MVNPSRQDSQGQSGRYKPVAEKALGARQPCPKCLGTRYMRSRRRGLLECLSRVVRLSPFRCDICGHRFWRFTWRGH
jgi:hypothetical protein